MAGRAKVKGRLKGIYIDFKENSYFLSVSFPQRTFKPLNGKYVYYHYEYNLRIEIDKKLVVTTSKDNNFVTFKIPLPDNNSFIPFQSEADVYIEFHEKDKTIKIEDKTQFKNAIHSISIQYR